MSESFEGFSVAVTRQNAGTAANREPFVTAPAGVGGVNAPASTVLANVMVVFGSAREPRLSQVAAVTGDALNASITASADNQKATQCNLSMRMTAPPVSSVKVRHDGSR